jgi:NTE family protein
VPLFSEGLSLATRRGAYAGDWIHEWLLRELEGLGVRTFTRFLDARVASRV